MESLVFFYWPLDPRFLGSPCGIWNKMAKREKNCCLLHCFGFDELRALHCGLRRVRLEVHNIIVKLVSRRIKRIPAKTYISIVRTDYVLVVCNGH